MYNPCAASRSLISQLTLLKNIMSSSATWADSNKRQLLMHIMEGKTLSEISTIMNVSKTVLELKCARLLRISKNYEHIICVGIQKEIKCFKDKYPDIVNKFLSIPDNKVEDEQDSIEELLENKPDIISGILNDTADEIVVEGDIVDDIENNEEVDDFIILNEEQKRCITTVINERKSVFITGAAGVGKTGVLKELVKQLTKFRFGTFGVTAATGAAAILISGTTIHSLLGIGLAKGKAEDLHESTKYRYVKEKYNFLRYDLRILIVDEISMISSILLDKIDKYLQLIKVNDLPFGGVQMVFCGDLCQLAPVDINLYCFESRSWKRLDPVCINLTIQYRQNNDDEFKNILSELRFGKCTPAIYDRLKQCKREPTPINGIVPTNLYSTNRSVDSKNQQEFKKLLKKNNVSPTVYKVITMTQDKKLIKNTMKNNNIPEKVELAIGAQIMVTFNISVRDGLVNGTLGTVIELHTQHIVISSMTNRIYDVGYINCIHPDADPYSRENIHILFKYMPVVLAYSISIHKCVAFDTMVCTKEGLKHIISLEGKEFEKNSSNRINNDIMGFNGYQLATQLYVGDMEDTLEIITSNGYMIEGSYRHPILIAIDTTASTHTWRLLPQLKCGDTLVMKYNTLCFGKSISTKPFHNSLVLSNNDSPKVNYQGIVSHAIAKCIGSFIKNKIVVDSKDYVLKMFIDLWCGVNHHFVPWVILENTADIHQAFLQILFDVTNKNLESYTKNLGNPSLGFATTYKSLVKDVTSMLLNLGILPIVNELDGTFIINIQNKYIKKLYDVPSGEPTILYQTIKHINKSKNYLYDLYVPSDHTFIGNGFINHNSQGRTIDYVVVDVGPKIFATGQGYTALSRAKSLDTLIISELDEDSFKCDPKVKRFYKSII